MMKDEVSEIRLRSCPFCGEKVKLHHGCSGNPFISCSKCRLDMGGDSENEVIRKWNRRASAMIKVESGRYDEVYEEGVKALT